MMRYYLPLLIAICFTPVAIAQQRTVEFQAVCPKFANKVYQLYYPDSPLPADGAEYQGKWGKLDLNLYNVSRKHRVKVRRNVLFFAEPSEKSRVVATVKVPKKTNEVIFLFDPNLEDSTYRVVAIDNASAPQGSFYIINASSQNLYFKINGIKQAIPAGRQASIKPVAGSNKVSIYQSKGQNVKLKKHTKWYIDEKLREFVFYFGSGQKWKHITDNSVRITEQR